MFGEHLREPLLCSFAASLRFRSEFGGRLMIPCSASSACRRSTDAFRKASEYSWFVVRKGLQGLEGEHVGELPHGALETCRRADHDTLRVGARIFEPSIRTDRVHQGASDPRGPLALADVEPEHGVGRGLLRCSRDRGRHARNRSPIRAFALRDRSTGSR